MHSTSSKQEIIQFIKELLKKNNRVIIPNFGAFIVSQGTSDKILFNNFLSFNDGLLTGHLAEQKQLEKNDALIQVNELVEEIRYALETTNEYHLAGLGHFTKDHQGILRFNQDTDAMSATATVIPEPKAKPFATRDLLDIDASSAPVVEEEKPVEVTIPPSFAKEKLLTIDSEKPAEVAAVDPHDADLQFEKASRNEKPKPQAPVAKPVAKPVNPKYVEPQKKVEPIDNKRNKNLVLIFITIFVILPLIGLGVYFIGYKDQFKWFKNKPTQETAVTPPAPAANSTPVTTPEPATVTTPKVVAPSGNGITYHIIVRTFSTDKDAAAYTDKLKAKGFANATYFSRGSKYVVSIDNRASIVEADARQEEIVNQYRIESYVLTVK